MGPMSVETDYTDDEIYHAVVAAIKEMAGKDFEVTPSMSMVQIERDVDDSLFGLILNIELEKILKLHFTQDEIWQFYKLPSPCDDRSFSEWERDVAPALTVAAFADFIRKRCMPVNFEPISVLGSPPCPAAGYFVGMTELVQQIEPSAKRFGPSTPVTQVLSSGSLKVFWGRLSRAAAQTLPPLSFWLNWIANVLLVASAVCLVIGLFVDWAFLATVWLLCIKGIHIGLWLHRRSNPLPRGIVTFGDLARHLANQR